MKTYEKIYNLVKKIPKGKVTTYGQLGQILGFDPRVVGWALNKLAHKHNIPWHRVINAKGEISLRSKRSTEPLQRKLLQQEGIVFDRDARVSLIRFRWQPKFR